MNTPNGVLQEGLAMSQSLTQIYLHIVFSTKDRMPFLADSGFRDRVHAYLAGICKNLECPALIVGGVDDHAHTLCRFGKTIAVATLIQELKRDSSKWIKSEESRLGDFHWQAGYGAFSISPSHVDGLRAYIQNQDEHHRRESFQDEFRRLCKKYGTEIDERYVWQ
jgi:REP element-mobilizing transposase RayT